MLRARVMFHRRRMEGLLLGWQEGSLSPWLQRAMAGHLERCGECRLRLSRLAETDALLRASRPPFLEAAAEPTPELFHQALRAARRTRSPFRRAVPAWGLACVLALMGATAASRYASLSARRTEGPAVAQAPGIPAGAAESVGETPPSAPAPPATLGRRPAAHAVLFAKAALHAERRAVPAAESMLKLQPEAEQRVALAQTSLPTELLTDPAPNVHLTGAPADPQAGMLVVEVSEPALKVEVREASADAPGYARAAAVTEDASGAPVLAQYTIDSKTPGSQLVLTPMQLPPVETAQAADTFVNASAPIREPLKGEK